MKCFIAAALLLISYYVNAQQQPIHAVVSRSVVRQSRYQPVLQANGQIQMLPCAFGKAVLDFSAVSFNPDSVQVTAIDLVFTDYPSYDALIGLNQARIQHLFEKYPALAHDSAIEWRLVRQLDGAAKTAALALFHGFVIYYRPLQNNTTIKNDLLKLKDLLAPDYSTLKNQHGFVAADTNETKKRYEVEEYTTIVKLPVATALQVLGIDEREKTTYKNYDSLFVYLKPVADSSITTAVKAPPDSTVLKVLDRMQWDEMLVVADVTASMYVYTGQTLLWLKLHEEERRIKGFAFFNDGDNKEEDAKQPGSTGGIYTSSSSVFEVLEALVYKVMSNGNGGGIPENNVEALLKGAAASGGCRNIVMIADNASGVSDMSMLRQLNKPVHIIACGVHHTVNTNFLDIAKFTGGSVHTAEEDLQLAVDMQEGATISLHGVSYQIKNGRFIVLRQ